MTDTCDKSLMHDRTDDYRASGGSVRTLVDGTCVCGTCRDCRRADKEWAKFEEPKPVALLSDTQMTAVRKARKQEILSGDNRGGAELEKRVRRGQGPRNLPTGPGSRGGMTPAERAKARREAQRARRARLKAERVVDGKGRLIHPDAPHGTMTGYVEYGCQCEPCVNDRRRRERERYHAKKQG